MRFTRRRRTTGLVVAAFVGATALIGCSGGTTTRDRSAGTTVKSPPTRTDTARSSADTLGFSIEGGQLQPANPNAAARLLFAFLIARYAGPPGDETPGTLLQTGQLDPTGTSIALDVFANRTADLQQACAKFAPAAGYLLGTSNYQLRLTGITPVSNGPLVPSKTFPPLICRPAPKTSRDPAVPYASNVADLEQQVSVFISKFYDHVSWYGGIGGAIGPGIDAAYVIYADRSVALTHCTALRSLTLWFTGSSRYKIGVTPEPDPNTSELPATVPCPG